MKREGRKKERKEEERRQKRKRGRKGEGKTREERKGEERRRRKREGRKKWRGRRKERKGERREKGRTEEGRERKKSVHLGSSALMQYGPGWLDRCDFLFICIIVVPRSCSPDQSPGVPGAVQTEPIASVLTSN